MCLSFTLTSMEYQDVLSYISLSRMSVSACNLAWNKSSLCELCKDYNCVPLSHASDSGVARICQRGSNRGSKTTERGEGVSPPPVVGIFVIVCVSKRHVSHITGIIRGS